MSDNIMFAYILFSGMGELDEGTPGPKLYQEILMLMLYASSDTITLAVDRLSTWLPA